MKFSTLSVIALSLMQGTLVLAAPKYIRVQGRLTDNSGAPICCNPQLRFELHTTENGVSRIWGPQEQSLETNQNGLYSTELGPFEPADLAIFAQQERLYLDVSVRALAGWQTMRPRQSLSSVPYAFFSQTSEKADISKAVSERSIGSENIKAGAVTTDEIQDGGIQTVDLATGAVTSTVIADEAVSSADIENRSIEWVDLSTSAVRDENIQDAGISGIKIASGAVDTVNLAPGAVTAEKLNVDAVKTAAVQDEAITAEKIKPGAVGLAQLNPEVFEKTIPAGLIAMFAGDCPQGWNYFELLEDRFPRGVRIYTGELKGSDAISGLTTSTSGAHAHASSVGDHKHGPGTLRANVSFSTTRDNASGGGSFDHVAFSQSIPINSGETGPAIPLGPPVPGSEDGAHAHPIESDGTWVPSYLGVVYCVKN